MPLWDTLGSDPLTLNQILSLWKRDSVEDIIIRRSEAEEDAITRMWIETHGAYHGLENPHDARWTRFEHVKKGSEEDTQGIPTTAFGEADTFLFSRCVQHVEAVGGRQFMVGDLPDMPWLDDADSEKLGVPDLADADTLGPDDINEYGGDTEAFTVASGVEYAPFVEYGREPTTADGLLDRVEIHGSPRLEPVHSRLTALRARLQQAESESGSR